ncbi:hypothetical protein RQP46_001466 [Phenoliferia psychrophenolica]
MKLSQSFCFVGLFTLALAGPLKPRAATDACVSGAGASPSGAPGFIRSETCSSDGDCASSGVGEGQACDNNCRTPFICDNGTCKSPPASNGDACDSSLACQSGKICFDNVCQDKFSLGDACSFGSGAYCDSGFCAGKSDGTNMGKCATPSSNTPDGNQCYATADGGTECGTDSYCFASDAGPGNVCTAKGAPGGRCLYEVKSFSCLTGVCGSDYKCPAETTVAGPTETTVAGPAETTVAGKSNGETCATNEECKSNTCPADTKKCTGNLGEGQACAADYQCSPPAAVTGDDTQDNVPQTVAVGQVDTQAGITQNVVPQTAAVGQAVTQVATQNGVPRTATVGEVFTQVTTQGGVAKTVLSTAATAGLVRATVASTPASGSTTRSGSGGRAVSSLIVVSLLACVPIVLL